MIDSFVAYLTHLEKFGDKPAISTAEGKDALSFAELVKVVQAKSIWLHSHVNSGERVIFSNLDGPQWVVHYLACLVSGIVAVPLDARMSETLKAEIIAAVKPKLILGKHETSIPVTTVTPDLKFKPHKPITFKKLKPQTLACILYTSGTWGNPKGVMLSHSNLLSNLHAVSNRYTPKSDEVFLSVLPPAHAYEQMVGMLIPLYAGAQIVYQQKLDGASLKQSLSKYKITTLVAVPRLLEVIRTAIVKETRRNRRYLLLHACLWIARFLPQRTRRKLFAQVHRGLGGALETLVVGGAPLPINDQRFFQQLGFKVFIGYGLTETSPVITVCLDQHNLLGCVGKVIDGTKIRVKPDGEVEVRGPNVCMGYWPQVESPSRWFPTGDIGRLDHLGHLLLSGRKKNQVIFSTGDKIDLEFIEQLASEIPGVVEAAACDIGNADRPQLVVGFVGDVSPEVILQEINRQLPLFARVKKVVPLSAGSLLRTHTLKLDRVAVHKLLISKFL